MHPSSLRYRLLVLTCNCLLTLGSYYVFDVPSVLEDDLKDLLHIDSKEYSLFYSLYGWTNCLMSLCAGWIVDRYGYRRSAFLFLGLVIVGQTLFALGSSLKPLGPHGQFYLMLAGRFIFGTGGGSITIVQNAISAHWFKGKELAVAFGVTLTMSRIGSVINFFTTRTLCNQTSISFTLWFGVVACCLGLVAAFFFAVLDRHAEHVLGTTYTGSGKVVNLRDVRLFETRYWLLCLLICAFYVCIFPFIATAPKMFRDRLHMGEHSRVPSYLASTVYFTSILCSIPFGRMIDTRGRQSIWAITGCCLALISFLLFALTKIYPLWIMLVLGVSYSLMASALWPSIAMVVPLSSVGSAMGLATSLQMLGVGSVTLAAGAIQDSSFGWHGSNLFFACLELVAVFLAVLLLFVDVGFKDGMLSKTKSQRENEMERENERERQRERGSRRLGSGGRDEKFAPLLESVPQTDLP